MEIHRVDIYWSNFFGLKPEEFLTPGIFVVPHARLANFSGAWVYRHKQTIVLSVPPGWVDLLLKKVTKINIDRIHSPQTTEYLFGDAIQRTVGPAYQGYAELKDFQPQPSSLVRLLSDEDNSDLEELADSGDPTGWRDGGSDRKKDFCFGYYLDEKVVAVSGYIKFPDKAAFPGIFTHPSYRGKGYAKAVLSAAFQHAFDQGFFIAYQTLLSHIAAVRVAEALGCRKYAQNIVVRLKE